MITRKHRVLLIVNCLRTNEPSFKKWNPLYGTLEKIGVSAAKRVLGPVYSKVAVLSGKNATKPKFLHALASLSKRKGVKAVDVFLQLHGKPGRVSFYDDSVASSTLRDEILARGITRLRLMYSTCCYGDSHSADFLSAGFRAAIGAKATNTTSATEYPLFLSLWHTHTAKQAISSADVKVTRDIQDKIARGLHFPNPNSKKIFRGDARITLRGRRG